MSDLKKLAILLVENANSGLAHDFFARIIDAFKVQAEDRGYTISFLNTNPAYLKDHSYLDQMLQNEYDGLFIANISYGVDSIGELIERNMKIVTIDYFMPGVHGILSDNEHGIEEMMEYIIGQGHKKIAFITGDKESYVNKCRFEKYKEMMEKNDCIMLPEYICESTYRDMRMAGRRTEELLALPVPPTCIMYSDDYAAIGGINVFRNRGLEIPKDISFCGYDGVNLVSFFDPMITTVIQDTRTMGIKAADKLIEMIETDTVGDGKCTIVPTKLQQGNTVKRIFE